MKCQRCGFENKESAMFCTKCGSPLNEPNKIEVKKENSDMTKYLLIVLVVVIIILAMTTFFVLNSNNNVQSNSPNPTPTTTTQQSTSATPTTSSMSILGGSFSTGSSLSAKTYAKIYVGSGHSGEQVTVQIWYSRDGVTLNNGNMVPAHVDSAGYISITSAEAYSKYPDHATINLYDSSGSTLLDSRSINLSPTSGTQTF